MKAIFFKHERGKFGNINCCRVFGFTHNDEFLHGTSS